MTKSFCIDIDQVSEIVAESLNMYDGFEEDAIVTVRTQFLSKGDGDEKEWIMTIEISENTEEAA